MLLCAFFVQGLGALFISSSYSSAWDSEFFLRSLVLLDVSRLHRKPLLPQFLLIVFSSGSKVKMVYLLLLSWVILFDVSYVCFKAEAVYLSI